MACGERDTEVYMIVLLSQMPLSAAWGVWRESWNRAQRMWWIECFLVLVWPIITVITAVMSIAAILVCLASDAPVGTWLYLPLWTWLSITVVGGTAVWIARGEYCGFGFAHPMLYASIQSLVEWLCGDQSFVCGLVLFYLRSLQILVFSLGLPHMAFYVAATICLLSLVLQASSLLCGPNRFSIRAVAQRLATDCVFLYPPVGVLCFATPGFAFVYLDMNESKTRSIAWLACLVWIWMLTVFGWCRMERRLATFHDETVHRDLGGVGVWCTMVILFLTALVVIFCIPMHIIHSQVEIVSSSVLFGGSLVFTSLFICTLSRLYMHLPLLWRQRRQHCAHQIRLLSSQILTE